jgi:DNA polymerase/3'-5' exonuclease PolX
LREYAQRTALRGGNPYRAKAYSRAADSLAGLAEPQTKILQNLAIAKGGEGRLHMHRADALLQHAKAAHSGM